MDSKKIRNKLAKHCEGNLKKYFNMVEIANLLLLKNNNLKVSEEADFFEEVSSIYVKKFCMK